jgi:peptide/nickel transport system permease protein
VSIPVGNNKNSLGTGVGSTTTTQGVEQLAATTVGVVPALSAPPPAGGGRLRDFMRMITTNPKFGVGIAIVAIFILLAILGPFFVHGDPNAFVGTSLDEPSAQHLLGTTQTGQDVLAQMLVGTRSSVMWGFITGIVLTIISISIGMAAGYFGGIVDDVLSLFINVFLVLPAFPLAIVLAAFFPFKGELTVSIVIAITGWSWNARVFRAQTMSLRERDFVQAARSSGETTFRIIFAEILPNQISIVVGALIGTIVYVIGAAAGLEFLGLGNASDISWGTILFWAQNNDAIVQGSYWWFLPPILCLAILGAGLTLINFGIDEVANPRLRRELKPKKFKSTQKAVA